MQEITGKSNGNRPPIENEWHILRVGTVLAIWSKCKIRLASTFSQNLSSQTQAKLSPRSNERVAHFWKQLVHLSVSQRKGFCAFFRKVQRVKHSNPPLPHTQIWKKPSKNSTFASSLRVFPRLRLSFATHHRVDEAPVTLKSCEESFQSVKKKRVLIPKWAKTGGQTPFFAHLARCFSFFFHRNNRNEGDFLLFRCHFSAIYGF